MIIRFEELSTAQRSGGIESATHGLQERLANLGLRVVRSSSLEVTNCNSIPHCVHIHGIWSPKLARQWWHWNRLRVPIVVSTHGMLEPWAFKHKKTKKMVAWYLYQRPILKRVSALHATSVTESDNLAALGLGIPVETIPWGIDIPSNTSNVRNTRIGNRTRNALFVGRIYPVKGLPMLVEAWAKVRPEGWNLIIVGPDEAGHRADVEKLVRQAKLENVIQFAGSRTGIDLQQAYDDADLFVLPSHTENFGMVVGEALANGIPVITTHGTPWRDLLTKRCGWWTTISAAGIADALADATKMSDISRAEMGQRGRQWIASDFSWDQTALKILRLYESSIEKRAAEVTSD